MWMEKAKLKWVSLLSAGLLSFSLPLRVSAEEATIAPTDPSAIEDVILLPEALAPEPTAVEQQVTADQIVIDTINNQIPPSEEPVAAATPTEEQVAPGLVPVTLIQSEPEVGGAALDADLDRIAELFRNVATVGPNAPVFPGVNSTEVNIANNYLNGLWGSPDGLSGLMGQLISLIENPGRATEAQRNRIRDLFETNFLAMLRRATNLPDANRVYIATHKPGTLLLFYIKSGLSDDTSTLLTLYRELRANQDGLLARLGGIASTAVYTPEFVAPYQNLMWPFDGNIFGIVVMLNKAEAELVPLLGRGMVLTPEEQRAARREIMLAASDRAIALADLSYAARPLGNMAMDCLLSNAFDPVGTLYKSWADVMRAAANLVTAGEEATAPAREVYVKVIDVSPWITELISLFYPGVDSQGSVSRKYREGLLAAKQVVDEMPLMELLTLRLLTEEQRTRLLQEYQREFQVLRLRLIGIAQYLGLTNAGMISGVVNAVGSIVRAMSTLALSRATLTWEEWSTIYTEVSDCIYFAAGRVAGMEEGFTRVDSVRSLAWSTRVFALTMIEVIRVGGPTFLDVRVAIFLSGNFGIPAILGRLRAIALAPRVGESGETMMQAVDDAQRGFESLGEYIDMFFRPIL